MKAGVELAFFSLLSFSWCFTHLAAFCLLVGRHDSGCAGLAGDGERLSTKMKARFGGREERSNSLALVVRVGMEVMVQLLCKPKPCICCGLGRAAPFAPEAAN